MSHYTQWKGWEEKAFGKYLRKEARYFAWHIARALPSVASPSVLEVGFGNGAFLGYCRAQGWAVCGLEREDTLLGRAREAGFEAFRDLQELGEDSRFDLIAMFDVLEHIPASDLVPALSGLGARLKPGGAILVRVPNGDSPFGRAYQHGDLTHLTTFAMAKVHQLAALCGLCVVAMGEAPPWCSCQDPRTLRTLLRAGLRCLVGRLIGFAYFNCHMDFDPNLFVVLRAAQG